MTRLADFKSNAYHEGELQTNSTNLLLTGTKYWAMEATQRASGSAQFPAGMTAIAIGDQPSSLAGDTLDNTSAIGRRFNTFDFRDAPSGSAWMTGISMDGAVSAATYGQNDGSAIIFDILWWNGQNVTTASNSSTINSPTWPARDRNGATSGDGVGIGILSFANLSAVTDLTITYTNSGGTGSRTGTLTAGVPTGAAGIVSLFELQAGDTGVRQVNSLNRTTALSSANYVLFAYRIIGHVRLQNYHAVGAGVTRVGLLDFPAKIYSGSVLTFGAIMTTGWATTLASWRARYSYSSL